MKAFCEGCIVRNKVTGAGTVSQSTFTGASMATVPPYLVVAMWQRTA